MSVLTLVAACGASRSVAQRAAACPLSHRDSVFLAGGPVYRDCAVDSKAKLIPASAKVDYRPSRVGNACYTVELQMVVDASGKPEPSTIQMIRTNDGAFADAVLQTVPSLRYEPATLEQARVRQIVFEKQTMGTMVVAVPAGRSPPPSSAVPRKPNC